jgi:hypothetical protein
VQVEERRRRHVRPGGSRYLLDPRHTADQRAHVDIDFPSPCRCILPGGDLVIQFEEGSNVASWQNDYNLN